MQAVVRPKTVDEVSDALREAAGQVSLRGGESKSSWGGLAEPADVVVDLSELRGIVEYSPGDLVVTVRAGTPLAELQGQLAEHGQWLPLDPLEAAATVGGIIAAAASGPRRMRHGTPRDLLLGVTVVLPDGTVARSGGKVVKNVAGYDLGKLFGGSFGTLGAIATCTVRLRPLLPARRVVSVDCERPGAAVTALRTVDAVPSAAEWDGRCAHVLVESTPAAAESQAADLAIALGGTTSDKLPECFIRRPWESGRDVVLRVTFLPSRLDRVLSDLRDGFPNGRFSAHLGTGVAWAVLAPEDIDGAQLAGVRATVSAHGGTVVVLSAPDEAKQRLDVWGPVDGLDVMRRIKAEFDPDGKMVRGRFVGGI